MQILASFTIWRAIACFLSRPPQMEQHGYILHVSLNIYNIYVIYSRTIYALYKYSLRA